MLTHLYLVLDLAGYGSQTPPLPNTLLTSAISRPSPAGPNLDPHQPPNFSSLSAANAVDSAIEHAQHILKDTLDTPSILVVDDDDDFVQRNDTQDDSYLYWTSSKSQPDDWSSRDGVTRDIPDYVYEYAPVVHLFSGEKFWPSDIEHHLRHVDPYVNYTDVSAENPAPDSSNLADLNKYGRRIFLQSQDNVENRPTWLTSEYGIPKGPSDRNATGHSDAPAYLVVVNKGKGIVDAFWFFFYSYNLGNKVLNVRFGNHVGDWEHTMVRFHKGKPQAVFYSEHFFGQAYTFDAVEKHGKRPISYSATGTHAMYATAGIHRYILPWGLLHDETDRGPLWDPALNVQSYTFSLKDKKLYASSKTPDSPIRWFDYIGHWGDKGYPMTDRRQYQFAGQYHYVDGPKGPRFKDLGREGMCQGKAECTVNSWLVPTQVRRWPGDQQIGAEPSLEE